MVRQAKARRENARQNGEEQGNRRIVGLRLTLFITRAASKFSPSDTEERYQSILLSAFGGHPVIRIEVVSSSISNDIKE
jgi:hypothetical protein